MRAAAVVCLVFLAFGWVVFRMAWFGFVPSDEPKVRALAAHAQHETRGDIYDRNGVLLATSLKVHSLYADPKLVMDVEEAVTKLQDVLGLSQDYLRKRLKRGGRFVWIKRHLTPEKAYAVNSLGLPGLGFREETVRVYPQQRLAAHVLGAVNVDGKGQAGVEATQNTILRRGDDVHLTLDVRLQQQLEYTLAETFEESDAKGVWGMVSDPATGEILAMASFPDFDPNQYGQFGPDQWLNRNLHSVQEMGSTFKAITLAQAVDEGAADLSTTFDCRFPLQVGRFTIRDFHPRGGHMTAKEIFTHSSNIGAAQIADVIGGDRQRSFFGQLNLLTALDNTGLRQTSQPLYSDRWGRIQAMTRSYGHGIAVTAMHMIGAINTLVYDGQYRTPYVVKGLERNPPMPVIKAETVTKVRELMRNVVHEGSGRRAALVGYDIGGKTGTAEKPDAGSYSTSKNVASFVGAVPLDDPRLVGIIMVDEGKSGYNRGGLVAAPAFGRLIKRIVPIMGIEPALMPEELRTASFKEIFVDHVAELTSEPRHR